MSKVLNNPLRKNALIKKYSAIPQAEWRDALKKDERAFTDEEIEEIIVFLSTNTVQQVNEPSAPTPEQKSPAKPRKAPKVPPQFFVFRAVNPPGAKMRIGNVHAPWYIKAEDNIRWPYHFDGMDYHPVAVEDEETPMLVSNGYGGWIDNPELVWLPRQIRYVFGQPSIFVDEQEKGKNTAFQRDANGRNTLLDNPSNRDNLTLVRFERRVPAAERTAWLYLWCMNQCKNQHPKARRNGTSTVVFELLDFGQIEEGKIELGKLKEQCYQLAVHARDEEMIPHAKHLGILFYIEDSGAPRDIANVREDYKDMAYTNPKLFHDTYNDPKMKIIYWVNQARDRGELSIGSIKQGQAHWAKSQKFITLLPPNEDPVIHLADFSLTVEGEEFATYLRAVNLTR
jgi:hypothetical protein